MAGFMSVQIIGHLGRDPEVRYTADGGAIASTSIAYSEQWKDKRTGEKQERTEWVNLVFFGRVAEIAAEYLKKGSQCFVEGKLRTEKYTDKEGIERYSTKVVVNQLRLLGGRPEGDRPARQRREEAPTHTGTGPSQPRQSPQQSASFDDDDIPF